MLKKISGILLGSLLTSFSVANSLVDNSSLNLETNSSCVKGKPTTSNIYGATHWYRHSAEQTALYWSVFNQALNSVDTQVKQHKYKPNSWGVILDIDETVLNNSEYEKRQTLGCFGYSPKTMYSFMEEEKSVATPGAVKFTCGIEKIGGKIVLVTNRDGTFDAKIQTATINNLKKAGICFSNVVFANGSHDSNKTLRFNKVISGHYNDIIASNKKLPALNIIAYVGDNIQDFPNTNQQNATKDKLDKFGQEYFILPNPMYGSWQANSYN